MLVKIILKVIYSLYYQLTIPNFLFIKNQLLPQNLPYKTKRREWWFWDKIRENKGEKYLKMKGMKLPRAMLNIPVAEI